MRIFFLVSNNTERLLPISQACFMSTPVSQKKIWVMFRIRQSEIIIWSGQQKNTLRPTCTMKRLSSVSVWTLISIDDCWHFYQSNKYVQQKFCIKYLNISNISTRNLWLVSFLKLKKDGNIWNTYICWLYETKAMAVKFP